MTRRCRELIKVPLPDDNVMRNATLALQCQKNVGHTGLHRNDERILWTNTHTAKEPT